MFGIETGPGALLFALGGSIIGGVAGYFGMGRLLDVNATPIPYPPWYKG
jgi:hypothetical protein